MTFRLMIDDETADPDEYRCDDCHQPLDQLGPRCVACAADREADETYRRAGDR